MKNLSKYSLLFIQVIYSDFSIDSFIFHTVLSVYSFLLAILAVLP